MRRLALPAWSLCVVVACAIAVDAQHSAEVPGRVAAIVGERTVTGAELDALVAEKLVKLRADEYATRRRALDEHVNRLLLEQEAARRGQPLADFLRAEVESRIEPVTDAEARAVHDASPARGAGPASAQDLSRIATTLRQTRLAESRRRVVDDLRRRTPVRVLLDPPRVMFDTTSGPSRGAPDAPVTIVVFSDFQCPFCRAVTPTLRRVETEYQGRVRVVFRDFPLTGHTDAPKAAEAARCAADQGAFWEMHDALFAGSGLREADLKARAGDVGLDTALFNACLDSGRHAAAWQQDRALGQRLGVSATPTFFINGRMLSGALPFEAFRDVVVEELDRREGAR